MFLFFQVNCNGIGIFLSWGPLNNYFPGNKLQQYFLKSQEMN